MVEDSRSEMMLGSQKKDNISSLDQGALSIGSTPLSRGMVILRI